MIPLMLSVIGTWIVSDGVLSIMLYLKSMDNTGKRMQSWRYDHIIRLVRIICGIVIIAIAFIIK